MIKIESIALSVPFPCDSCGALKLRLTVIRFINFNKGFPLYLCYRCKDVLHGQLGKYINE